MPKGGARARSGPAPDPTSGRSERRGRAAAGPAGKVYSVTALPSEGYGGRAPAFPLPRMDRHFALGGVDEKSSRAFRAREIAIWREVWKYPQACAWLADSWRWPTIGEYCRVKAAVELDAGGNASLVSRLREYRNEIGLSPDGLKMNGWAIAVDEVAQQAAKPAAAKKTAAPARRLRGLPGASAAG